MLTRLSPPSCPYCGSVYVLPTQLLEPQEAHAGVVQHECQVCLRRFQDTDACMGRGACPVGNGAPAHGGRLAHRLATGGMMFLVFVLLGSAWVLMIGSRPCALSYLLWR